MPNYGTQEERLAQAIVDRMIEKGVGTGGGGGGSTDMTETNARLGAKNEAAAATDTAVSGLNGFFKRLLEKIPVLSLLGDRLKVNSESLVRTSNRKFRDDFAGTALSSAWQVVNGQPGAGQTITVASSELTIAAGITANSETIIRSVDTFKIPFQVFAILKLSQRIINQEFYLEIIDSSGQHYAHWHFDGTNAVNAKINTANNGNTINATSGVVADTRAYVAIELNLGSKEINFSTRLEGIQAKTPGMVRTRQIPDPSLNYYLQIRSKNLAAAPASPTSYILDSVVVQETEEFTAEISGGRGGGNLNELIGVAVGNVPSVSLTGTSVVCDSTIFAVDLAMPLTANGTQTTSGKDCTNRNTARGWIFTNVPGTLFIEQSSDNSIWRILESIDVPGDAVFAKKFESKVYQRYLRFRYVNGATAQTVMQLVSTTFAIGA